LLYDSICDDWSRLAVQLTPDEMPSLGRIREIYFKNNIDMEQKGIRALDDVKERLVDVPALMEQATVEVEKFDRILEGTGDLLNKLYKAEADAAERLFLWAGH
ncbi:MAG: hypothetical protein ACXABN_15740, partial [Candidatus Thorarchaeota archaeon]